MKTKADFDLYLLCVDECRKWGQLAAIHNEGWDTNPYEPFGYHWLLWGEAYNRELARLAMVAECLTAGELEECEAALDAHDPQPKSFVARVFSMVCFWR